MNLHANAPFGPKGRLTMVRRVTEQGWSLTEAAEAAGVSERTVSKWSGRYRAEGEAGLWDRSSEPRSVPHRTPEDRVEAIAALRRVRMTGPEIAECLEAPNRYERDRPGELIHIDVKKLVRIEKGAGHRVTGKRTSQAKGAGWEFVHVCVDDATRLAYVEVLGNERASTAIGFLRRAVAFYAAHGIAVAGLMTDNGNAYRSTAHAIACRAMRIRHIRTRPYRPRTNGKAERFIRTMLGGWAYGAIYRDSKERTAALSGWLDFYNWRRPHGSLSRRPPGARLAELNNVAGSYI
jgi:transposase InsO family protein